MPTLGALPRAAEEVGVQSLASPPRARRRSGAGWQRWTKRRTGRAAGGAGREAGAAAALAGPEGGGETGRGTFLGKRHSNRTPNARRAPASPAPRARTERSGPCGSFCSRWGAPLSPLGRPTVAPRAGGTQAASRGPCAQSKCLKRETRGRALIPPGRGGPTGRRARASPAGRHLLAQVGAGAPALTVPKGSWRFAPSARSPRSGRTARRRQRAPEAAAPARPARARPPLPGLGASATGEKPKTWGGQTYRPLQQVCLSALHFRCVRDDNV